jgi:NAD(P)-dependent dehydrogenase (short-subunit alcohol dehydrogenase family)
MSSKGIVLITGASSGLGKATGAYLAEKGYRVYGTTRNTARYQDFRLFPLLQMDVHQESTVQQAVAEILSREGRIDVLINNAGVGITGPMEEISHADRRAAMETNFHGPLRVMEAVLPTMRKQGAGCIINITSIAGYMGLPYRGMYSASKGALQIATEAYRMELRKFGIRVCTLAPGDFATNIAAGRYQSPQLKTSPYGTEYAHSLKLMNEHVEDGKDPIQVARKIHRLIQTGNPGIHYTVGSPLQRVSLLLKRILPGRLFERLLRNHYKL